MTKGIRYAILGGVVSSLLSVSSSASQLQVDVPFAPTAFTSTDGGYSSYELVPPTADEPLTLRRIDASKRHQQDSQPAAMSTHLAYELVLKNTGDTPLTLQHVEIAGVSGRNTTPIVTYAGSDLDAQLAFPARKQSPADNDRLQLKPNEQVVMNLFLSFDDGKRVPTQLRHLIYARDMLIETPPVGTHHSRLRVLGPPLRGGNWFVMGGPGATGMAAYHRRNTFILNGSPEAARRYAIDWVKIEDGEMRRGKPTDNASYFGYGQEVLAVADGVIATALDGIPENIPGRAPPLQPTTPVCMSCGNHVVLEFAPGQFATYMHLRPGSLRVAKGDRVQRGQVLGRVGNSGDSNLPHLHFHVATEPGFTGQGLPYLIERFSVIEPARASRVHTRELPLNGMVIDFGS